MKHSNSTSCCKGHPFAAPKSNSLHSVVLIITFVFSGLVFTGCQKDGVLPEANTSEGRANLTESNVLNDYSNLGMQTRQELEQARAATAKYKHLKNAEKDGYININVVMPNMGYHYMKPTLVDGTFDYTQPEILVYNKDLNGNYYLVAIEYAVPINLPEPSGFTGSSDVWTHHTGFQLWLLHAWVWNYNPAGVFNPTNASVHVH